MIKDIQPLDQLPFDYIDKEQLFDNLQNILIYKNINGKLTKIFAENNECFGFTIDNNTTYCDNNRITELINIVLN